MVQVRDGITHLPGCLQSGHYDRYEERISHSATNFVKTCRDCQRGVVLWVSCVFEGQLSPNQKSKREREILRELYTEAEKAEKRLARLAWIVGGRRDHAPGCKRTHKTPRTIINKIVALPYETRVYTRAICPGCKGVFEDLLDY